MNLLALRKLPSVEMVSDWPVQPRVKGRGPYPPAASPEDAIAREAVAKITEEEGFWSCAEHRRRGAYDGDTEHQVALMAIKLFRQGDTK